MKSRHNAFGGVVKFAKALVRKGLSWSQFSYVDGMYIKDGEYDDWPLYWGNAVNASPVAARCYSLLKSLLIGRGFEDAIGELEVNDKGQTLNELLEEVVSDYAMWERFALKVKLNTRGERFLYCLQSEFCRYGIPDTEQGYKVDRVIYNPWINTYSPQAEHVTHYPLFEPGKEQREYNEEVKAWLANREYSKGEYYGHAMFYNATAPSSRTYSRPSAFAAEGDVIADGQESVLLRTTFTNGMLLSGALLMYGDPNEVLTDEFGRETTRADALNEILENMALGASNGGGILNFWTQTYPDGQTAPKPEFLPFQHGNAHEMLATASHLVRQRIAINYGIPEVLLGVSTPGRLGATNEMREAIKFANANTDYHRRKLENLLYPLVEDRLNRTQKKNFRIREMRDWSDLPDTIFASLSPNQREKYLLENFGIEPDPDAPAPQPIAPEPQPNPDENGNDPASTE